MGKKTNKDNLKRYKRWILEKTASVYYVTDSLHWDNPAFNSLMEVKKKEGLDNETLFERELGIDIHQKYYTKDEKESLERLLEKIN